MRNQSLGVTVTDLGVGNHDSESLLRVLEVTRRLAMSYELNEVLSQIIEAGTDVLSAERGTVFLLDEQLNELYSTVGTGVSDGEIRVSADEGIVGLCVRDRGVINVPDCSSDPRFSHQVDRQTGYQTRSLLSVPLIGLENRLVGVLQLLNSSRVAFDTEDERIAGVLASQAAVAIQRARLLEERMVKLKLESDLDLARQIQMGVLPKKVPNIDGYDLACYSQPADRTGGDIYDLVLTRTRGHRTPRLMIMLADATGHGIGPALSVTQVRAMFRVGLRVEVSLDDLVAHINDQLIEDLSSDRFVTAFLGALDPIQNTIEYHAAGQGPLLHYHATTQESRWYVASGPPLGVVEGCPWERPSDLTINPGDVFVLLTDGIYEYTNPQNEAFGKPRVEKVITEHAHQPAQEILEQLLVDLTSFAAGHPQNDDLTAVIIKRNR